VKIEGSSNWAIWLFTICDFLKVSICDVNSSTGDTLAQELGQKFNKSVIFCPCDVTDYPQSEGTLNFECIVFHLKLLAGVTLSI
jgi:hypothetical protein